ncbi:MAG: hypothetical protein ACK4M9_13555 [Anaerobacillus sp.]|uniref:hypothetical protein n=1 Tax=Anaerobacillus sp. TaxID=1872506 RepID=UPI00391A7286
MKKYRDWVNRVQEFILVEKIDEVKEMVCKKTSSLPYRWLAKKYGKFKENSDIHILKGDEPLSPVDLGGISEGVNLF